LKLYKDEQFLMEIGMEDVVASCYKRTQSFALFQAEAKARNKCRKKINQHFPGEITGANPGCPGN